MIPRISVIMSCYNNDATLAAAVDSILGQTIRDIELIIVDDGSRDGSAGMARLLAIDDRRIRLLRQTRSGALAARNRGIAAATGEYLAFAGAAEIWPHDHLARHLTVMDGTPECGVTTDAAGAPVLAHAAVLAEAGPFNAELVDDEREWIARVLALTDWDIQTVSGRDETRRRQTLYTVAPSAAAAVGRRGPAGSGLRARLGLLAARLAGAPGRRFAAG
jgi:glycosyltransferase involved in cell wall biosynthesis